MFKSSDETLLLLQLGGVGGVLAMGDSYLGLEFLVSVGKLHIFCDLNLIENESWDRSFKLRKMFNLRKCT